MKVIIFTLLMVAALALHLPEADLFNAFPIGKITLKSDVGKYLGRCNGCGPGGFPDSVGVHILSPDTIWGIWTAQFVGDDKIALKADNGKYLAICTNCWTQGATGGADSAFVQAVTPIGNPGVLWTPEQIGDGTWYLRGSNGKYLNRCTNCVNGGITSNFAFVSTTSIPKPEAQWIVEKAFPFPTGPITLQSDSNNYLGVCTGFGPGKFPDSARVHLNNPNYIWAIWTAEFVGHQVSIKSNYNGKYLAICNNCWTQGTTGGADSAFVYIDTPSNPIALWIPQYLGNGKWALKGSNGKYLNRCSNCVTGSQYYNDIAFVSATNISTPAAQWTIGRAYPFPTGSVTLQSAENDNYLTICTGCGPGSSPDSASVHMTESNVWATWTSIFVNEKIALRANNGKYLALCTNCWTQGATDGADSAFVHVASAVGNSAALWTPEYVENRKWALRGSNGKYLKSCYQCVTGGVADSFAFVSATNISLPEAQWTVGKTVPFPTGPITLESDIETYLTICTSCGPGATPDSAAAYMTVPSVLSALIAELVINTTVALKANNGKYLSKCSNCWTQGIIGGADSAFFLPATPASQTAAQWYPISLGNGKWALKGSNGKYLSRCQNCVSSGITPHFAFVNAMSFQDTPTAQWTVESTFPFPLGLVTIKGNNGNYLATCDSCGPGKYPTAASVHTTLLNIWTIWLVQYVSNNKVALRGENGNYLSRCSNCWTQGGRGGADPAFVYISNPVGNPTAQFTPINIGNGKWAFQGDNGWYLQTCEQCVTGATAANFPFVSAQNYQNTIEAQWTVVRY